MARKSDRKPLGRGLSALLGDTAPVSTGPDDPAGAGAPALIDVDLVESNPDQPRQNFREDELEELAGSIRRHGIIQPVVLRPRPGRTGAYQIVAGERRWRAAQRAQVHAIPAIVRDLDDRQVLELAIIENIQRVDLNPIEEAQGYVRLIETFGHTQAELASIVGKSRSHVANTMRLLALPEPVIGLVRSGRLTAGHARALINAPDPVALAEKVVAQGLTVRQAEDLARKIPRTGNARKDPREKSRKDADTRLLEGDLSAAIGMSVRIEHGPDGSGTLRIRYRDLDQLDSLCRKLSE